MKIVTIVENDCITGVKYGVKEIPETPTIVQHNYPSYDYNRVMASRTARIARIRAEKQKNK